MITVYSEDGERRLIHSVDLSGYLSLGWSTERMPVITNEPEVKPEPKPETPTVKVPALTANSIKTLSWRDQKSLLSPEQQDEKPDHLTWEEYAIAVLVEE